MERKKALKAQRKAMDIAEGAAAFCGIPMLLDVSAQWNRGGGLVSGSVSNALLSLFAIDLQSDYAVDTWQDRITLAPGVALIRRGIGGIKDGVDDDGEFYMDAEVVRAQRLIESALHYTPTKQAVSDAITLYALSNAYNPVVDIFSALPSWDGVNRLWELAPRFGAADTELNNAVLALIPRAVYARAMSDAPVKFDYAPILYSERQGVGKTRALEAFALKPEFYREGVEFDGFDVKRKIQERIQGALVVELGEIGGMRRREMAALKSILTSPTLTNRLAYGRNPKMAVVRSVFVGTTNERHMLTDISNRRFPVVECKEVDIDTDGLADDMPQIYAEAAAEWDMSIPEVALPRHLWGEALAVSEAHRELGAFEEWATEYLSDKEAVKSSELRASWRAVEYYSAVGNAEFSSVMGKLGFTPGQVNRARGWRRIYRQGGE